MTIKVNVLINADVEKVWGIISDIENSINVITAINKIEVLNKPAEGLVDLKWRETRTMFGKEATEVMWITEAVENHHYKTRAESHGSVYISELSVMKQNGGIELTMAFGAEPQTFGAKFMWATMGFMFKGSTKKALQQDLEDIKVAAEA